MRTKLEWATGKSRALTAFVTQFQIWSLSIGEVRTYWNRFSSSVLDALYPPRCGVCGELGERSLCDSCFNDFEPNVAEPESVEGLDFRHSVYKYRGRAAQAVTRLKYSRSTTLGRPMSELVCEAGNALGLLSSFTVVPVPIHWTRRSWRGFNQAELLCSALPRELVEPELLKRIRATRPQAGLSVAERQRNLEGAFRASPKVDRRAILLIDDVVTSGQTARACAAELYDKGAVEVGILAFAGNPDQDFAAL